MYKKAYNFDKYDSILFLAKSIGTIVSGVLSSNLSKNIKHINFTPVNETLQFMNGDTIVFSGKKDPMINTEKLVEEYKNKKIRLYIYDNCNHSMETGDIKKDIEILLDISEECEEYIVNI